MTSTTHPHGDPRPGVLHVLHTLGIAGAEVLVRDLVAALGDRYRFTVVALDAGGPLEASLRERGARVEVLGRRPGFDPSCAAALARIARRDRIEVVHAHQYTPFVYAGLARLRGGGARLIFTEHGRHYPDHRRVKRVLANRLLLGPLAERITAVGEFVKQALVANEALPARRIRVIRNGIDPARFAEPGRSREAIRRELSIDGDTPMILQVAGFRPVKDHATALRAMRSLIGGGCGAVLLLAGEGPTLEPTRRLAAELGLERQVRFLGNRRDISDLWHAADIGLLSSLSEGVSVAILEAMACGRPVVATDVGGNGEVVEQGVTGLLAPRGDHGAIAGALRRLCDDAGLRAAMGAAGIERVRERFDQRRMHAAFADLYSELIAGREVCDAA